MKADIEQMRRELEQLRIELSELRQQMQTDRDHLVCKSLSLQNDHGTELLQIGPRGLSAGILIHCQSGQRLEMQGQFEDQALRMFSPRSDKVLFSIGGVADHGDIRACNSETGAFAQLRGMRSTGFVDTYGGDTHLTGRLPTPHIGEV